MYVLIRVSRFDKFLSSEICTQTLQHMHTVRLSRLSAFPPLIFPPPLLPPHPSLLLSAAVIYIHSLIRSLQQAGMKAGGPLLLTPPIPPIPLPPTPHTGGVRHKSARIEDDGFKLKDLLRLVYIHVYTVYREDGGLKNFFYP